MRYNRFIKKSVHLALMCFIGLAIQNSSLAQTALEDLKPRVIPPNPDAASLGKYADFQNNNYTGSPSIAIGIHDVVENDVRTSVSLSYDASGVKVQTPSTWVGLGWTLNAGGVITRSVRGIVDGKAGTNYTSLSQSTIQSAIMGSGGGLLTGNNLINIKAIASGSMDADPDIYYLSAGGLTAKFIETQDGIVTLDLSELKIERKANGWRVYDQQGFIYTFDQTEETQPNNYKDTRDFVSAWFLSSIKSPNGSVVNFIYKTGGKEKTPISKSQSYDITLGITGFPIAQTPTRTSNSWSYSKKRLILDKITYSTGQIVFTSTEGRLDAPSSDATNLVLSTGYKLNGITVLTPEGDTVKHFALLNSYFHNGGTGFANYRLRLDGVVEAPSQWHVNANKQTKKHTFEYYAPTDLPSVESDNMDHWGYHLPGAGLIPGYSLSEQRVYSNGRDATGIVMSAGALKRIYYPTTGYTDFEFEPHDYSLVAATPVNEDIITQYDRNARAKRPEGGGWLSQGVSEDFVIDAQTISTTMNITFAFSSLSNYSQLKLEIYRKNYESPYEDSIPPGTPFTNELVEFFWAQETPVSEQISLSTGIYFLKASTTANNASVTGTLTIKQKTGTKHEKYAGGLRLKRMISFDPVTQKNLIKKFTYRDAANPTLSSGVLVTPVKYDFSRKTVQAQVCGTVGGQPLYCDDMPNGCDSVIPTFRIEVRSSPPYALGQTQGSFIGYKCVQIEELNELSQPLGRTVETYIGADNFVDQTRTFPSVTGTILEVFRGKLVTQKFYDQSDRILYEKENRYEPYSGKLYMGAAVVDVYSHSATADPSNTCAYEISFYDNTPGKAILTRTTEKAYSYVASAQQVKTTKTSFYTEKKNPLPIGRAHTFPTKTVQWINGADSITTTMTYAVDLSGTAVLDTMYNRHIISPQIETIQVLSPGSKTLYKRKSDYAFFGGKPLLSSVQEAGDGITYIESIHFNDYDSLGRVIHWKDRGNVAEYYMWNKKRNLPALKITGTTVANVFSNDFENSSGNSSDAHSGTKSRSGTYLFTKTGLTNGTYNLTYWQKQGSWILKTSVVTVSGNTYSTTLTGLIDDVRLYPVNTQLTNFIYDNAGRLTCILDQNSIPGYFDYDKLGRLEVVRDDNKKILKTYQYQYQIR